MQFDLSDYVTAEIAVVNQTGAIVQTNRRWKETAKAGGLFVKRACGNYIEECEAAIERGCNSTEILTGLRAVLQGKQPSFVATYPCPFDGLYHWFQVSISALESGSQRYAVLMHVDVSAMQRDPLTGLRNRAVFDAQLSFALSLACDSGCRTGIVIIDMNNLKVINDKYGHLAGDEALKMLAGEIERKAGSGDVVTRIGGDEFGVVLPVNCDMLSARRLKAQFGTGISSSIGFAQHPIPITASIGTAIYPDDGATSGDLFRAADKSMYADKRGKSLVC
jgi:diguanylate cyclase (GGDEF)-like protein